MEEFLVIARTSEDTKKDLQGKVLKCNLQFWPIFFTQVGHLLPFTNTKGFVPLFRLRQNKPF